MGNSQAIDNFVGFICQRHYTNRASYIFEIVEKGMNQMKILKRLPQNQTKLAKKVNPVKKSDNSNIKWFLEKVVVPIAIAVIPALIPLAITYITPQNTQQPANPAIDRTIPSSK